MQALYLACTRGRKVIIVEQQKDVGGLFASARTPFGLIDVGVHLLLETGMPEWDTLYYEILSSQDWHILEGVRKDIGGNYIWGKLNDGALYPDLRQLPRHEYLECLGDLFANLPPTIQPYGDFDSLEEYLVARFGPKTTERVFRPAAHKLWREDLDRLSSWAAKIVHFARVLTHDPTMSLVLKDSPVLDQVIGFPDQLSVPRSRLSSDRRGLYPRKYGLAGFVVAARTKLEAHGVEILSSTQVATLEAPGRSITTAVLRSEQGEQRIPVSAVLWTSPLTSLLPLLGLQPTKPPDAPLPHRIVQLFLSERLQSGELYWFWCLDPKLQAVRISNHSAYCPDAASNGLFPVCVETHVPTTDLSDQAACDLVVEELRQMDLIRNTTAVRAAFVSPAQRSFFVPTLKNVRALGEQRQQFTSVELKNLFLSTQDLSEGIFYLPDILRHSLSMLNALD